MKAPQFLFLITLACGTPAWAEEALSFSELWSQVRANAPSLRAATAGVEAAETARARADRHVLPKVSAEARAFETNDPAQNLFGLLGQRSIQSSDFAPDSLNHPNAQFLTRATLGVELPLYEGGAPSAQAKAMASKEQAAKSGKLDAEARTYVESAFHYGVVILSRRQAQDLTTLHEQVKTVLDHYRLGTKSNPVGYSGMLGLRGLKNRLEAALAAVQSQERASRASISELAPTVHRDWAPTSAELQDFARTALPIPGGTQEPPSVSQAKNSAEAAERMADAEKARFLPKVALFVQGDLTQGNRAAATSYTAGGLLQWQLFSGSNLGAVKEARASAVQAEGMAAAAAQQSRIAGITAREKAQSAEETLKLLSENAKLLSEQTATSRRLFQNGSLNALQFVEVLSRRADLIEAMGHASSDLLTARSDLLLATSFEVPHE